MDKGVKFGVYIPEELANEVKECMKSLGFKSKSRLVQEALRLFIIEHKWRTAGCAVGVIGVVYNHEAKGVDEGLTDIQHNYLDLIIATLHVHLDREKCMLAIAVRGETTKIRDLLKRISTLRGVYMAKPLLLETV